MRGGAGAGVRVMVASIRAGSGVGETRLTISGSGSKSESAGSRESLNKVLLTHEGHSWISSSKLWEQNLHTLWVMQKKAEAGLW